MPELLEPLDLGKYSDALAQACVGISEVWLIGSRANGTARENSDWDLLIMGAGDTLKCLKSQNSLHRADVDCLVSSGTQFKNAWGKRKELSVEQLQWRPASESRATYTGTHWCDREGSTGVVSGRFNAIRVWKR